MMRYFSLLTSAWLGLLSCQAQKPADPKAAAIIEACIATHGGKAYKNLDIALDFRAFKVQLTQKGGKFRYVRTTQDSLGNTLTDVLDNTGFTRSKNGQPVTPEEKYREGLNALAYFLLLPYKLSEPAVNLRYLGETTLEGQPYHKIEVTFDAAGGGKDHEDVYCYWIHQEKHTMDYLAYASGGPRFRKATRQVRVGGVLFQDYENFEILDKSIPTHTYDQAFREGKARLLSKIEQTNYRDLRKE